MSTPFKSQVPAFCTSQVSVSSHSSQLFFAAQSMTSLKHQSLSHNLQTFAFVFHILLLLAALKTPFFPTEIFIKNCVFRFATLLWVFLSLQPSSSCIFITSLLASLSLSTSTGHLLWHLLFFPLVHWPQGFFFHPSFNTTPVIFSFHLFVSSSCYSLADSSSMGLSCQHICWKPKSSSVTPFSFHTATILGTFGTHYVPN